MQLDFRRGSFRKRILEAGYIRRTSLQEHRMSECGMPLHSVSRVFPSTVQGRKYQTLLKQKMDGTSFFKLMALENEKLLNFIGEWVEICDPDSVFMCNDSEEDAEFIRRKALEKREELPLAKADRPSIMMGMVTKAARQAQLNS